MVKQYTCTNYDGEMVEFEGGGWVAYEDYQKLAAYAERLRAALQAIADGHEWSGSNCRETAAEALAAEGEIK